MSFFISALFLLVTILTIYRIWSSLQILTPGARITSVITMFGLISIIFWGITTKDQYHILQTLAGILEKPLNYFFILVELFLVYLVFRSIKSLYQQIQTGNCSLWRIFFSILNVITFIILVAQGFYYFLIEPFS